ncbi:MAG: hypothetical protein DYG88_04805 [Chloroflexi bacterium CFX4]|nr:hypothetical protein [Chloroflexi bacterium CFX4]
MQICAPLLWQTCQMDLRELFKQVMLWKFIAVLNSMKALLRSVSPAFHNKDSGQTQAMVVFRWSLVRAVY